MKQKGKALIIYLDGYFLPLFSHMRDAGYLMSSSYEPRSEETGLRGFRPCLTQTGLYNHKRWIENLKFLISKVEGLYYLCSENKGADQLRGYREADLRLICFRIYEKPVFSRRGSYDLECRQLKFTRVPLLSSKKKTTYSRAS